MARSSKAALGKRIGGVAAATNALDDWAPATEVLTRVKSVPTIFPQLDRATGVRGWPEQRVALLHGPSNHGKTLVALGLGFSWLLAGGLFGFIDAEHSTPVDWLGKLMGEHAGDIGFRALRPKSYEQTIDRVRAFTAAAQAAKVPGIVVVDSIGKLMPQALIKKISAHGAESAKGSADGYSGRAGQLRASYHKAWLDELVPLLYHTGCSVVLITRESEGDDPLHGFKVGGGVAPVYESSLVVRVTRQSWVRNPPSSKDGPVVGERHRARIWKTKIGGKLHGTVSDAYIHTSNGVLVPEGFDRPRDLLELGSELGVVKRTKGGSLSTLGKKWRWETTAVEQLHKAENSELLARLETACREKF